MNTTTTIDLDRQRAEFEAWYFPKFGPQKMLGDSDQYYLSSTQGAWQAWQAALARRSNAGEAAAQAEAPALDADEMTRLRRLMRALDMADDGGNDAYVRGLLFTVLGQAASRIERAATQQAAREQQEPVADLLLALQAVLDTCSTKSGAPRMSHLGIIAALNTAIDLATLAAPVAQQSEAGAVTLPKANGVSRNAEYPTSMLVFFDRELTDDEMRSLHDQLRKPTEAGAPTAPAEWPDTIQKAANLAHAYGHPELHAKLKAISLNLASGRESAAPAAPVREGDREQDVKDEPCTKCDGNGNLYNSRGYYYGKCSCAAMQKGASNG